MKPKACVWSERSDLMQCWVWRYGIQTGPRPEDRIPAGTATQWIDAMMHAELLYLAQSRTVPQLVG